MIVTEDGRSDTILQDCTMRKDICKNHDNLCKVSKKIYAAYLGMKLRLDINV